MQNIKYVSFLVLLFAFKMAESQSVEIYGKVESHAGFENIHVINKTAQVFTTTNKIGEFKITAKLNDTLVFSSIQHIPKYIVVSDQVVLNRALTVTLKEQINELGEVLVGKILSGDLLLDIEQIEGEPPINCYDVGIPGYTGKLATQSERRLHEAGEFKPKMLLGLLGGGIPLNPILNGISGRTKELKNRVDIETKEALLENIKARLEKDFLNIYSLEADRVADFFYFCADDAHFIERCKNKTDIEILEFLKEKLKVYKTNLESITD
ncbi:hypothetical protein [Hwangdonia lutea]|uniref:Carboxypeptidase-like regulatory domain-containing protein n=1 Tax=Hwangdonia lutea TaxID=3075823 RepID=A0AA97EJG6_9FLAO|nr:hypothetical protein [Hwangdonia sp. SCSIO 19198]WOD42357.1 hypothetical protein RNZ46_10145 [Hwangdonia sp. SCSIO 19198]